MTIKKFFPPISLPVIFFALVIGIGTVFLHNPSSLASGLLSWTDALFTAASAVCVTGLTVVDTGTQFSRFGQSVILILIQVGGLGIMTFSSLSFYLWRRRVSLTDRIAIGQSILHDQNFHLGKFLTLLIFWTFFLETVGAISIFTLDPAGFPPFSALFHAISAFCNAGFALQSDNLTAWRGHWGINMVIMTLITLGGLGFSVIIELQSYIPKKLRISTIRGKCRLSWYTAVVIKTSLFMVVFGWAGIYIAEYIGFSKTPPLSDSLLTALFQSVTCRTAGFNTLDIGHMTNVALLIMLILMFIGGAPGSCAGGIKVTTFRVLAAFVSTQLRGRNQIVVKKFAIAEPAVNKALILIIFAVTIIFAATLILNITEGGNIPHPQARGFFMDVLFETVSAFGTVGLSTGLTAKLSLTGKWIIALLMFIGRLGPLVFLAVIHEIRQEQFFKWPEENILIG